MLMVRKIFSKELFNVGSKYHKVKRRKEEGIYCFGEFRKKYHFV
jgi:hypothetical protein